MNDDLSPEPSEETAYAEGDKAALERKGALKPCEACGGDFAPLGLRGFLQSVEDADAIVPGVGTVAVMAVCVRCGLIRLHAEEILSAEDESNATG